MVRSLQGSFTDVALYTCIKAALFAKLTVVVAGTEGEGVAIVGARTSLNSHLRTQVSSYGRRIW